MGHASLTKHRTVMKRLATFFDTVHFKTEDEDAGPLLTDACHITRSDWEEMGKPDVITVTVEPGDMLNV